MTQIGLLRAADLSLAEIDSILGDPALAGERLEQAAHALDRRQADRKLLIGHIQSVLTEGADPMFEIQTRHVGAQRVMSMQRRLHAHETDAFVREAKVTFNAHLGDEQAAGPFMLIFHACSPIVAGHAPLRLSCREVYLADPDTIGDDDLVCDVAFPY